MESKATEGPAPVVCYDMVENDHARGDEQEVNETSLAEELSGLVTKSSQVAEGVTSDQGDDITIKKFSAVDKGYSWVVMIATFGLQFLLVGYLKSLGVLFVELQSRLGSSSTKTTIIVGTMEITSCISGFSIALTSGTPFVALVQYFDNNRAIATGISTCGASLGGVVFPLLFRHLINEYGFQGGVLMMAGVQMNTFIFSILLVPFEQYSRARIRTRTDSLTMEPLEANGFMAHEYNDQSSAIDIKKKYNDSTEAEFTELTEPAVKNDNTKSKGHEAGGKLVISGSTKKVHSKNGKLHPRTCFCGNNNLLRSVTFWLLGAFYFCASTGSVLGQTFLPVLAEEKRLTKDEGAFLVSIMNILDIPAHLIPGVIINFRLIRPGKITILPLLAIGTIGHLTALLHTYSSMMSISITYGLFMGVYYAVQPLIIVELLGPEHFSTALGIYFALTSLGPAISYPLCGALKDMSQTSTYTYHYIGSLHIAAALLIAISPLAKRYDVYRNVLGKQDQ
ncbi:hypothetical protein Btru_020458 [Bulinus truncatus]|nr:hypothetical protein Btru_020458 [Bulinus truncatus]